MAALRKFLAREPRFQLGPSDNRTARFSADEKHGLIHSSTILDLSLSGTAFVVDRQNAPFIYERIRIEVPLGHDESIAWWGKVVRVQQFQEPRWFEKGAEEAPESEKVIVGVKFELLPMGHATKVDRLLQKKFKEIEQQQKQRAWDSMKALASYYTWEILLYCFVAVAGMWILWALSQPTGNYSAEKGAPWGKRMWFVDPSTPKSE